MPDKKGIAYYKDWIYIILFVFTIIGFAVKAALVSDQVERNTQDIENAELKILVYKIGEIEKKVDAIYELVK